MVLPISVADERGLSGVSLDIRLRQALSALGDDEIREMAREVCVEAERREMTYLRDGQNEVIGVMLRPLAIFPEQLHYYHYVALTLLGALKRMPELYLRDPRVREVVPLSEGENRWLCDTWGPAHYQFHSVFGRLDAIADITTPFPKEGFSFIEPNLVGAGGIHLVPTTEQIMLDVVMPRVQQADPDLRLEALYDLRKLFIQEIYDHAEAIGAPGRTLCLIDAKYAPDGPNEFETLAHYYRARGYQVYHADPEELECRGTQVLYEGHPIDIAYRDIEVRELVEMETSGQNVGPMKQLLLNNQMVSSFAGDFDHKSCFELLTDAQFLPYFTMDERNVFRRHVLWTRVIRAAWTTDERGEAADLLEFIRANRDELVIKPNRSYGGENVLIGPSVTQGEWEAAISLALAEPGAWVVQRLAAIPGYEFPVVTSDQDCAMTAFYVVVGLAPTKYGLCLLGRASQKQVVNVALRGGMFAVLVGKQPPHIAAPLPPEALAHSSINP